MPDIKQQCSPVYDGTHVQADVLKHPDEALLDGPEVGQLVVHVDHLHAALEGALQRRRVGAQEVAWATRKGVKGQGQPVPGRSLSLNLLHSRRPLLRVVGASMSCPSDLQDYSWR